LVTTHGLAPGIAFAASTSIDMTVAFGAASAAWTP
jgi:hypothetical protein